MSKEMTMIRGVLTGPQRLEFHRQAVPQPGAGEALVRVHSCAVCTWEQRTYTGVDPRAYPLAGGHEIAGTVAALGKGIAEQFAVGDRVAVSMLYRCGYCTSCREGHDNLCDHMGAAPEEGAAGPGGFGEYVLAQARQLFKMSDDVSFQEAALAEPLACVLRSLKRLELRPTGTAVIVGAGAMGLLHLLLLKQRVGRVFVSEPHPDRASKARALGATATIDPEREDYVARVHELTGGRGADLTILAVGSIRATEAALKATAKNGCVQLFASTHPRDQQLAVNPNWFHDREITLTGTVSQTLQDFYGAAKLISERRIDLSSLVSARFPLPELESALKASLKPQTYRVLVDVPTDMGHQL